MSASEVTISVLLPVHAGVDPDHLRAAIDSVVGQTRPPDEVIVVEDGPLPRASISLLVDLESSLSHVVRVRLGANQGAGVANEAGLRVATGTWIAKVDADDINLPHRFAVQLALVRDRGLDVCGAAMLEFDEDPAAPLGVRANPVSHADIARRMRINNPINHPTAFFRRELALAVGGYPTMRFMQDYDLFARMLVAGAVMGNTDEVLVCFRSDGSMFRRRRGSQFRELEWELQRNLVQYGLIGPVARARNLVMRNTFRALPLPMMSRLYAALFRGPARPALRSHETSED